MRDVIGKLLKDNNMPDTPNARAIYRKMLEPDATQFYTNEARTWQGLTPEEVLDLFDLNNVYGSKWIQFARTVEAALKKKNT